MRKKAKSILTGVLLLLTGCTDSYISIDIEPNGISVDGSKVESLSDHLNKNYKDKEMKVMVFINAKAPAQASLDALAEISGAGFNNFGVETVR